MLSVVAAGSYGWKLYARNFASPDLQYKGYNLLLVTIDTLRADHVGSYGYKKAKTPVLDSLASEGYLFRRAVSHVPLTLPSHTSILTGTFPVFHGVRDNGAYFVRPQSLTLAEILKQNGYKTAAFVSAFVLDSKWGLDQGFDTYFDDFDITKADETGIGEVQRRGEETNRAALKWFSENSNSSPFFAWVHYYDPHDPYEPPEPYRAEFSDNPYDGEIAYADSLLGRIVNTLKEKQLLDKTIIIVTSDHGEGLGEHQERTHALFIYDSTLHVPLVVRLPGGSSGGEIKQTVQHVDLLPTILDLLQISKPSQLQGRSLIPFFKHESMPEVAALSESMYAQIHYGWSPLTSITTDKFKYIDAPKAELYNLQEDPRETKNLRDTQDPVAKASKQRIADLMEKHAPSAEMRQAAAQMDIESRESLEALGYIGSGPSEKMKQAGQSIDPKEKVHLVEMLHTAFADMRANRNAEARSKVDRITSEDPEIVDAYLLKGMVASKEQNYPLAVESFSQTLNLRPDHLIAVYNLALVHRKSGDAEKAIDGFKHVLKMDPHYVNAMVNLGELYMERNDVAQGLEYYQKAIERYQQMLNSSTTVEAIVSIHSTLSGTYFSQGNIDAAEKEIREIIKLKADYPEAHYNLAQVHEKKERWTDAVNEYKEELRYHPDNFKAYNDLAVLLRRAGRHGEAVAVLEQAVRLQPDQFGAVFMLADSLFRSNGDLNVARNMAAKAVALNPQYSPGRDLLSQIESRLGM